MSKKALKDLPLQELTLRKYESPDGLSKEELAKKFLLSIGLLQPGESRDIIVPIFLALLNARTEKSHITIAQLTEQFEGRAGASAPNIRRQLRRLKDLKLVERQTQGYRIAEFGSLKPVINDFIVQFLVNPTTDRLRQYAERLDEE